MGIIEGSIPRGAGVERGPGNTYYADANNGSNSYGGSGWRDAKLTIAAALAVMGEGDTLYLSGKFREQVTLSNLLGGVSIIGAAERLPAHADAPWESGASWLPPASPAATTPLLTVRSQGVTVENIMFDPPADAPAIKLVRNALSGNSEYDASHFHAKNCRFEAGQDHIELVECGFLVIEHCFFRGATGTSIKSSAGSGVAAPYCVRILDNWFSENANHIVAALNYGFITGNRFGKFTTKGIDLAGDGVSNVVTGNYLSGTYSVVGGYTVADATDDWGGNWNTGVGVLTTSDPA